MKPIKLWSIASLSVFCGLSLFLCACTDYKTEIRPISGTLDGPLGPDSAPAWIQETIERAERFYNYEIMSDTAHAICVEAIAEADTTSTEQYGIIVEKGATSTTFPNLCNARCPSARYDEKTNTLWLACSAVWGTGVQTDRLYQMGFDNNDKAYIARVVDPYDLQQHLCRRLGYRIEGEEITLYDGEREIARATNTVTDMGGFDEDAPLWIGEQLQYDLSGDAPCLLVTPGVKFTTGLVLIYDDMPTLRVPLAIRKNTNTDPQDAENTDSIMLGDIRTSTEATENPMDK